MILQSDGTELNNRAASRGDRLVFDAYGTLFDFPGGLVTACHLFADDLVNLQHRR
jgi:hypothetical protein